MNNYPALPILALKVLPSIKVLSATQKETAGHPAFPQFSSLLLILIRVLCLSLRSLLLCTFLICYPLLSSNSVTNPAWCRWLLFSTLVLASPGVTYFCFMFCVMLQLLLWWYLLQSPCSLVSVFLLLSVALGLKVLVLLWNIYEFIYKVVSLLLGLFNVLRNFIGILLMYNVVLVSGVQQSESVMHIHISTHFKILFHIGHYRVLSKVPCAMCCCCC